MFEGRFTNAPHVPRGRAFLDSADMIRNPVDVFERYRARLGHTFSFHFGGAKRTVVSTDPELLSYVLKDNRENFHKSDIQVERMVEFQGKGLVNSHGAEWLRQRRLIAHGFKAKRMQTLFPMQSDVLADLMAGFDSDAPVEMHQLMVRFTLRMVGKSLFGRSMGDAELEQIGDTISTIQAFIVRQIVQPYKMPWFRISGQTEAHQKLRRAADQIVLQHIKARRQEGTGERDFLKLLLETPYHDTGVPMTEDQVLIESLQLMVAGNETSSNALAWIFYLLARHPEYLAQVRDEIREVIGDDDFTYANLQDLSLTQRVMDEALRLYPPFWMIDRIALADDEVCGVAIPAGTLVVPYIYGTHRNPDVWTDPETFDPSRFEPDRVKARPALGYLPFGAGPRVCIGKNMAVMQMLLIVATFVRAYDFRLVGSAPVGIRPMMLLRPDGPIMMQFRRLQAG